MGLVTTRFPASFAHFTSTITISNGVAARLVPACVTGPSLHRTSPACPVFRLTVPSASFALTSRSVSSTTARPAPRMLVQRFARARLAPAFERTRVIVLEQQDVVLRIDRHWIEVRLSQRRLLGRWPFDLDLNDPQRRGAGVLGDVHSGGTAPDGLTRAIVLVLRLAVFVKHPQVPAIQKNNHAIACVAVQRRLFARRLGCREDPHGFVFHHNPRFSEQRTRTGQKACNPNRKKIPRKSHMRNHSTAPAQALGVVEKSSQAPQAEACAATFPDACPSETRSVMIGACLFPRESKHPSHGHVRYSSRFRCRNLAHHPPRLADDRSIFRSSGVRGRVGGKARQGLRG